MRQEEQAFDPNLQRGISLIENSYLLKPFSVISISLRRKKIYFKGSGANIVVFLQQKKASRLRLIVGWLSRKYHTLAFSNLCANDLVKQIKQRYLKKEF